MLSLCVGLALLGKVDEQMIEVTPVYEPSTSGRAEQSFISKVRTDPTWRFNKSSLEGRLHLHYPLWV